MINRDETFIKSIMASKRYTKRFKKHLTKFIKTSKKMNEVELSPMLLDLNIKLHEEGIIKNNQDIQTSYGVLIVIIEDEIKFRKESKLK